MYINRFPKSKIDFSQLPLDIEIISMDRPLSHKELAEKFQEAKALYSYEYSTTCTMAMLCGCPLVVMRSLGGSRYEFSESVLSIYGGFGYTYSDDIESLKEAERGLVHFREKRKSEDEEAEFQINRFIELTQKAAKSSDRRSINPLAGWLGARVPSDSQRKQLAALAGRQSYVCLIVLDAQPWDASRNSFTSSYKAAHGVVPNLSCIVVTRQEDIWRSEQLPDTTIRPIDQGGVVPSINQALSDSRASWFAVIDPAVAIAPFEFLNLVLELQSAPDTCLSVYGDEFVEDENDISGAVLRPDFNLDMLLSHPSVMARHWFFRKEVLSLFGGFDDSINTAFEFDLILRILDQSGFGAFGHVAETIFLVNQGKYWVDADEERQVVLNHLSRRGYHAAAASPGRVAATYDIDYGHADTPSFSIIMIAKDCLSHLQTCVESILDKTEYSNYELLIFDNNSQAPEMKFWLDGLEGLGVSNIRVFRSEKTLERFGAVNRVASEARGEYLLSLSADIGIIQKDWLSLLLNHAQRPEVGVVGAKLLMKSGQVESGSLVAGLNGVSGATFVGSDANDAGYMNRLQVDQNCIFVSADCMVFEKELFVGLGGFDETLPDDLAEADFCLRATQTGRLNVWTPRSLVMRVSTSGEGEGQSKQSSAKRAQYAQCNQVVYERWLSYLANDPSYNRNLSLKGSGFEVEQRIDLSWQPQKLLGQKTVLVYPADQWGCGHYRVMQPIEAMKAQGVAGGMIAREWLTVPEMGRLEPDACVFQRQVTDEAIANMKHARDILKKPVIFELDDYLPNLPLKSAYRKNMPKDILKSLRRSLKQVDRFVVSTHPLAEAFKGLHSDIRVVENRLPLEWWEQLTSKRSQSEMPRVGWAGGIGHTGDLELVKAIVRDLAEEVDWVFLGMCPDSLRPYVKEVHEGVDIALYPQKLASLNLDLAIAPLEDNLFNRCKSNLRLLEYGACGFPVVCSDVEPYREHDLPVTRVKNRYKDWLDAIRMHLSDLNESARQGDDLRKTVCRDWMLTGENLRQWLDAWTEF